MKLSQFEASMLILLLAIVSINLVTQAKDRTDQVPHAVDLARMKQIESSNCKQLYGRAGERGCYQVRRAALMDVNEYLGTSYGTKDLLDHDKSRLIADTYANKVIPRYFKRLGIADSEEHRLIAYNMGITRMKHWYRSGGVLEELPARTRTHLERYRKAAAL